MTPQSSFIHADIFFYITSISVVVLSVLLVALLYYFVRIAMNLEHTSKRIREEGDNIIDDVSIIRESLEQQGGRIMSMFKLFAGFKKNTKKAGRKSEGKK